MSVALVDRSHGPLEWGYTIWDRHPPTGPSERHHQRRMGERQKASSVDESARKVCRHLRCSHHACNVHQPLGATPTGFGLLLYKSWAPDVVRPETLLGPRDSAQGLPTGTRAAGSGLETADLRLRQVLRIRRSTRNHHCQQAPLTIAVWAPMSFIRYFSMYRDSATPTLVRSRFQ